MATQELHKIDIISIKDIINKSLIMDGNPARYHLQTSTDEQDQSEPYTKMTFGSRDKNKPHKTILLVGETGTGKTTLINTMVNYMLDVKREDKVWFEITDDQSDRTSAHSQTSNITVYGFYLQESPIDLTIIDTPGYGDTRGNVFDERVPAIFHSLSKSAEGIHEIDAVCLVIMAHQNRLTDRQFYIFDGVQSLFGRDVVKNIVLLFTHSTGHPPKDALTAVKEAEIKCAMNDKNQPVYFLFDNCQSDAADEEYEIMQEHSWNLSFKGMKNFFDFLNGIKPITLKMTQNVLHTREQLEQKISNLKSRVEMIELKQNEQKQNQDALKKYKEDMTENENFEYKVVIPQKKLVDINTSLAKTALCCTVCEENCHYPGCWWASNLSWCSMMKKNHCRVCTNKCHYSKHMKSAQVYITEKKEETKSFQSLKDCYKSRISEGETLDKVLEEKIEELEKEKIDLVNEAFDCVNSLQKIALNTFSQFTSLHINDLIEKLEEIKEFKKAETLKNIKKEGEEKKTRTTESPAKNLKQGSPARHL